MPSSLQFSLVKRLVTVTRKVTEVATVDAKTWTEIPNQSLTLSLPQRHRVTYLSSVVNKVVARLTGVTPSARTKELPATVNTRCIVIVPHYCVFSSN